MITTAQINRLEKIADLKRIGALTDEEFEREKAKILEEPGGPTSAWSRNGAYSQPFVVPAVSGSPLEWIVMPLNRALDFDGRSRRKEYWMFFLGLVTIYLTLLAIGVIALGLSQGIGLLAGTVLVVCLVVSLALLLPSIAVQVRRFHDQNLSGWFVLLNLIPYFGSLIVLVFMCIPGTQGSNRFGPDPLED
jgi:uncharacterized membrane protein YhaH (DUF805 family)